MFPRHLILRMIAVSEGRIRTRSSANRGTWTASLKLIRTSCCSRVLDGVPWKWVKPVYRPVIWHFWAASVCQIVHDYLIRASDWVLRDLRCDERNEQTDLIDLPEASPIAKPLTHIMFHIEDAYFDQVSNILAYSDLPKFCQRRSIRSANVSSVTFAATSTRLERGEISYTY